MTPELLGGFADFTFPDIGFTENAIDDCIAVVDDNGTPANTADDVTLGTVCVGDANPTVFKHEIHLSLTDAQCKTITNKASFTTDDTGATGNDSATVTYCAPATPGYWRNHLAPISARLQSPRTGAAATARGRSPTCRKLLGTYNVDTIAKVKTRLRQDELQQPDERGNNALGCLAGHLLSSRAERGER